MVSPFHVKQFIVFSGGFATCFLWSGISPVNWVSGNPAGAGTAVPWLASGRGREVSAGGEQPPQETAEDGGRGGRGAGDEQ